MSSSLQAALASLAYIVAGALVILGSKYGVIDSTISDFLLGGIVSHLGFTGIPAVTSAVKSKSGAATPTPTPPVNMTRIG